MKPRRWKITVSLVTGERFSLQRTENLVVKRSTHAYMVQATNGVYHTFPWRNIAFLREEPLDEA